MYLHMNMQSIVEVLLQNTRNSKEKDLTIACSTFSKTKTRRNTCLIYILVSMLQSRQSIDGESPMTEVIIILPNYILK